MRQIPDRYGCRHIDLGPCELSNLEVRRPFNARSDSKQKRFADFTIRKDICRSQVMLLPSLVSPRSHGY